MHATQEDSLPLSMAAKKEAVGAIPVVPSFHIMERTAMKIPEDTLTVSNLLDRLFQYLKLHSIGYECEEDTGCFECTSPNMIEFAVQLWRGRSTGEEGKQLIVEVQRRGGCAIAMNAIRRSLLRHVNGGEHQDPPAVAAGRRRPFTEADSQSSLQRSPKRQRSLSPDTARMDCQDALVVALRLLESPLQDQRKLGLETLTVLTDSRLVSAQDARTASRALILGEGQVGLQLQQRLTSILRQVQPTLGRSGVGRDSFQGYTLGIYYHIILHTVANAFDLVYRETAAPRMDLNSNFWQTATACLMVSLEDASRKPHEATLAAKCLRYLLPATGIALHLNIPTMQTALRKNHELGRAYNLSLEEECRKTLSFL